MEAAIAMIEAMKNKLKDPNAPYFPMPYPLLPLGTFEIIHDTEVDLHDDPENPIIWKEYTRIQGNLVLKRAGRKKGGVEMYNNVKEEGEGSSSGGPRRGRLVMETNAQAQAYYRSLRNNGASAGGAAQQYMALPSLLPDVVRARGRRAVARSRSGRSAPPRPATSSPELGMQDAVNQVRMFFRTAFHAVQQK
ncbi:uncharacterized protein LOC107304533 [Oryza brachyantha]|uniref:uncharacterized protein LOC107304533 n=1 Tax=Oryza brachyantha TaxID=4533 RepID=UPI001ADBB14A|nr:uncharacterized protein LOC107304533 [Oryza brachyantha]